MKLFVTGGQEQLFKKWQGSEQYEEPNKGDRRPAQDFQTGAARWLSWLSMRLIILAQAMISHWESKPYVGLCADSVEPALDSLSPFLFAPPSPK